MSQNQVVHAEDSRTAASEVRASAQPPRDRRVARHRQQHGERLREAGGRGRLHLAIAGGAGRRRAGGGAVPAPATVAGSPAGAELGTRPPGASTPQGRHATAVVAGVPHGPPERLPVQPVLRALQGVAEAAVQHVERWVMAPLRNQTFFSLGELREAIGPLLAALNERPFKKTEGSRRSWFKDLDRPALKPLPAQRYEYAEWRKARVNIDYHIQVAHALYSVPHPLGRCEVDVRLTAQTVEIFHKHRRVAAHVRVHRKGGYATDPAHMPASHRAHAGWTPSGLIAWGRKTGPHTAAFVEQLLDSRPHPEQGYRSCLGLKELLRAYGAERLEAACRRALDIGTLSYGSVKSILSTGLDQADDQQYTLSLPTRHAHIRRPGYYTTPQNGKES